MAAKIIVLDLVPKNGRKSFGGKARVLVDNEGNKTLKSYNTLILTITHDGKYIPLANPDVISYTTSTHLISFCDMNKNQYTKLWKEYND